MVRILISIAAQKLKKIDVIARKKKKSRSWIFQEAIGQYLKRNDAQLVKNPQIR